MSAEQIRELQETKASLEYLLWSGDISDSENQRVSNILDALDELDLWLECLKISA